MKKYLVKILYTISALIITTSMVACGPSTNGNDDPDKGEIQTYIMEAEYVDLSDVKGGGHSNEASGVDVIYGDGTEAEKEAGWSNGYFVAFTHKEGVQLTFVFNASEAATGATIVLRLGSEMGELTFSPSSFSVNLNGEEIDYGNVTIASNSPSLGEMVFYDKTITTTATLVEGENILTLTVLANELAGGTTAGPIIDCVKITTNVELEWTELIDNPDRRGEI
ncbi:MAG: hypothetical protein PHD47_04930 [Acholeplasmataceae bacterium]|nr:hypothetical protein [Acholeplasmataceae bacterium]